MLFVVKTTWNKAYSILLYSILVDDTVFHNVLVANDCCLLDPCFIQPKIFDPFNLNDEKDYIPCTDIDPDSCYYNELSFSIQMNSNYRQFSNIRRTQSQNIAVYRLVLLLSLPNPLKPGVKLRMKM